MKTLEYLYYCVYKGTFVYTVSRAIAGVLGFYVINISILFVILMGLFKIEFAIDFEDAIKWSFAIIGILIVLVFLFFVNYFTNEKEKLIIDRYDEFHYSKKRLAIHGYLFLLSPLFFLAIEILILKWLVR